MQLVFDLYETAEEMMRQNLRRRNSRASPLEIERLLLAWLQERPGAERGDAQVGPVSAAARSAR